VAGTAVPILRHLIGAGDLSIFSEETVARIRGMLADVARQLLDALVGDEGHRVHSPGEVEVVGHALLDNTALVTHLHALTLEWQLTERLQGRLGLDPVASPLLQRALVSTQPLARSEAAAFLSTQVRWCHAQRGMGLPLAELPAELLDIALYTLRTLAGFEPALAERAGVVEDELRRSHDEASTRIGLATKLLATLSQEGGHQGLSISDAGVPLFLTAVATASNQSRDSVLRYTHRSQAVRLALAFRAAGLDDREVRAQVAAFDPSCALPDGLAQIDAVEAAAILSAPPQPRPYAL
jgi:hypothetical protein